MFPTIIIVVLVCFTALCGAGTVVSETPLNLMAFILWAATTSLVLGRLAPKVARWTAFLTRIGLIGLMGGIIIAAAFAPGKRIPTVLEQPVTIPANEMTMADLSEYCHWNRTDLPLKIWIPNGGAAKTMMIKFSSTQMPLKQFIAELEEQSGSTHHFGGCGNAYSILRGSAYTFGLSFQPRTDLGQTWE